MTPKEFLKKSNDYFFERQMVKLCITKIIGNIIVVSNKLVLTKRILRINISYGFIAFAGTLSSLIKLIEI